MRAENASKWSHKLCEMFIFESKSWKPQVWDFWVFSQPAGRPAGQPKKIKEKTRFGVRDQFLWIRFKTENAMSSVHKLLSTFHESIEKVPFREIEKA